MKRIILFVFILLQTVALSACGNNKQDVIQPLNSLELLLLKEDISLGMKEGDLIALYGDGFRQEVNNIVVRIYPTDIFDMPNSRDYYYPRDFLQPGQDYNDVKNYPGLTFQIKYGFDKNSQLRMVMYQYDLSNLSTDELISFFSEMSSLLSNNFGEPVDTAEKWFNDRYIDDPTMLPIAIKNGEFKRITLWESNDMWVIFNIDSIVYTNNETDVFNTKAEINKLK